MTKLLKEKYPSQDQSALVGEVEQEQRKHENDTLDDALKATFPASDPVAIGVTRLIAADT
jgi:hypothetical protein